MRLATLCLVLAFAAAGFADTLTLRSGQVVNGTYLGGTARTIKMEVGDAIQTFDVSDVSGLTFTAPASQPDAPPPAPPPADAQPAPPPPAADNPPPPPSDTAPAPPAAVIDIPAGTNLTVRMIDAVDSETNSAGQTFRASLDEPVEINGQTVIDRGADVNVKLIEDKQAGKLTGQAQLTLSLASINVNGRMVDINTQSVTQASASRGSRTAKMAGGGAALGAIIGAIAGGGKGAAIGAGAGAAAGTGAEAATKGPKVKVPSETRLTFVLDAPVHL